jgi:hypothetical protein
MNRSQAILHVYERYRAMLDAARIPLEDSPDGIKAALDDAWAKIGVSTITPIPAVDLERFALALKIAVYQLVLHVFTTRYDKAIGGISLAQFDMFEGVIRLLKDARAEALALGLGSTESSYQEINLRPSTVWIRDEFGRRDIERVT